MSKQRDSAGRIPARPGNSSRNDGQPTLSAGQADGSRWRSAARHAAVESKKRWISSWVSAGAQDLIGHTKELKSADGVISGDLTEAGAKSLMTFGGRGGGGGPEISGAKGSVKFWVKDGVLTKMETKGNADLIWEKFF